MDSDDEHLDLQDADTPWQPTQLDIVSQQDEERAGDEDDLMNRMRGRCTLCEMEDTEIDGVTPEIAKIFESEQLQQRRMPDNMRYELVRKRICNVIDAAEETKEGLHYEFKRPTMRNVRRHFRYHEKTNLRQINKLIEYYEASIEELKRGALWSQSADGGPKQPQPHATNLLFKYVDQLQKLYVAAERLDRDRKQAMVSARKKAQPPSPFTRNRFVVKPPRPRDHA